MRIALLSDIHGHVTGLRAVLARLKTLGNVDAVYALGDYIGGGPGLDDVLDLVIAQQVRMIRGNWDEVFQGLDTHLAKITPARQDSYLRTTEWMLRNLSSDYQKLLAGLPITESLQLSPRYKLLLCHATPQDTSARVCQAGTPSALLQQRYGGVDAQIIAYGHYHSQHVIRLDDKLLINVASVGLGWQGLSSLTILEATTDDIRVQQYHIPYDTIEHDQLVTQRKMPDDPAIWYW